MIANTSKHRHKIKTLVVYGGSFDPIHLGHIQAIKTAIKTINPSLFLIVPAFRNPFKPHIKYNTRQRIKWIKRSIKSYINNPRIKLCLFEVKRNVPIPTILTIQYLRKTYNIQKIYFLLGADNLDHLYKWDEFEKLKQLVEFLFLTRDGYPSPPNTYQTLQLHIPTSSTQIREGKQREFLPRFLKHL